MTPKTRFKDALTTMCRGNDDTFTSLAVVQTAHLEPTQPNLDGIPRELHNHDHWFTRRRSPGPTAATYGPDCVQHGSTRPPPRHTMMGAAR